MRIICSSIVGDFCLCLGIGILCFIKLVMVLGLQMGPYITPQPFLCRNLTWHFWSSEKRLKWLPITREYRMNICIAHYSKCLFQLMSLFVHDRLQNFGIVWQITRGSIYSDKLCMSKLHEGHTYTNSQLELFPVLIVQQILCFLWRDWRVLGSCVSLNSLCYYW